MFLHKNLKITKEELPNFIANFINSNGLLNMLIFPDKIYNFDNKKSMTLAELNEIICLPLVL